MRALVFASALAVAGIASGPGTVAMAQSETVRLAPTDLSSQQARPPRARTRIRVTPADRAGRLVRECDFRLVREVRAAGTYVVPRKRCWWTRQR